jgi:hypothetical protein
MNISIKGKSVCFDNKYLHVELEDGRVILTPFSWYPELQQATFQQLNNYRFICKNTGIEWPDLDYHLSIISMMLSDQTKAA